MTRAAMPMTRRVLVVSPELRLAAGWTIMRKARFRHLPVVDRGQLLGILSDRDVLARSVVQPDGTFDVPNTLVGAAMTRAPYVCSPETSVADVARAMTELKFDAVPVVDKADRLIGLVTSTDLLLLLIDLEEAKAPLPFVFELDSPEAAAVA
ncbi:MAG: CBS domain-containing protein [Deltaproteobacteria bacterium]|nr:CBS domain-containing protein [Deltaproteobacteria bacterium]